MKVLLLILSGLLLSCQSYMHEYKEVRELIIIAGQSNAVGYDTKASELPESDLDQHVMFWWRVGDPPADKHDSSSSDQWETLRSQAKGNAKPLDFKKRQYGNFRYAEGGFGPEMGLARELLSQDNHLNLAILKVAFSGTSLEEDWNRASRSKRHCYRALLDEYHEAKEMAKEQDIDLRLRAFIWIQGESDSGPLKSLNYAKQLEHFVKSIRNDIGSRQLPFYFGVNTHFVQGQNVFISRIVKAQKSVAKNLNNCFYVDTSTASLANAIHFDSKGTLQVGKTFAESLMTK